MYSNNALDLDDPDVTSKKVEKEIDRLNPVSTAQTPVREPKSVEPPKRQHLLILYVMAKPDCVFHGYELLQSLLASGMRHGQMDIFHCYEQQGDDTSILFSLASATKPGTFDLARMGNFRTTGLNLFMALESQQNPMYTFDKMLEVAQQLAEDLDGVVMDNRRKPLEEETTAYYHKQIRDLEIKKRIPDVFGESDDVREAEHP